jgi:hypothetical protein
LLTGMFPISILLSIHHSHSDLLVACAWGWTFWEAPRQLQPHNPVSLPPTSPRPMASPSKPHTQSRWRPSRETHLTSTTRPSSRRLSPLSIRQRPRAQILLADL